LSNVNRHAILLSSHPYPITDVRVKDESSLKHIDDPFLLQFNSAGEELLTNMKSAGFAAMNKDGLGIGIPNLPTIITFIVKQSAMAS